MGHSKTSKHSFLEIWISTLKKLKLPFEFMALTDHLAEPYIFGRDQKAHNYQSEAWHVQRGARTITCIILQLLDINYKAKTRKWDRKMLSIMNNIFSKATFADLSENFVL